MSNFCAKNSNFPVKEVTKHPDFPYAKKSAWYVQFSAEYWIWQNQNFLYIQFRYDFPEKDE